MMRLFKSNPYQSHLVSLTSELGYSISMKPFEMLTANRRHKTEKLTFNGLSFQVICTGDWVVRLHVIKFDVLSLEVLLSLTTTRSEGDIILPVINTFHLQNR